MWASMGEHRGAAAVFMRSGSSRPGERGTDGEECPLTYTMYYEA